VNALNQICILSKDGVCLMDLKQVYEAAKANNFSLLAEIVKKSIDAKNSTGGDYYALLKQVGLA
jgi:hypothetical protein